jgi:hypothetical protein
MNFGIEVMHKVSAGTVAKGNDDGNQKGGDF